VIWQAATANKHVVLEFEVERKAEGSDAWQKISGILTKTGFEDTGVAAGVSYRYRVISLASVDLDDPVVAAVAGGLQLPPGQVRRTSSPSDTVATARAFYIVPMTVQPVSQEELIKNPDTKASSYIKVYRWDPETKAFLSKGFQVVVGETIGKVAKVRRREIDFSSRSTLLKVERTTRKNPKFGHDEQVQVIHVRHADGREEALNDKDTPGALKKKKKKKKKDGQE
jgi:hypothetical protein